LKKGTLHHSSIGKHGSTTVFMQPAPTARASSPAAPRAQCSTWSA